MHRGAESSRLETIKEELVDGAETKEHAAGITEAPRKATAVIPRLSPEQEFQQRILGWVNGIEVKAKTAVRLRG